MPRAGHRRLWARDDHSVSIFGGVVCEKRRPTADDCLEERDRRFHREGLAPVAASKADPFGIDGMRPVDRPDMSPRVLFPQSFSLRKPLD